MSMFSICHEVLAEGKLAESIVSLSEAESKFTREIGVLDRHYYQCVQQPHVIWAATEWETEKHHNVAAQAIMEVREDDRVASAYFRPGLYWEIFGLPVPGASVRPDAEPGGFLVIAHGLVTKPSVDGWEQRVASRLEQLGPLAGLRRLRTFGNYYTDNEFVAFFEWDDEKAYLATRMIDGRTVEEHVFIAEGRSDLAAYVQYECRPLEIKGS